MFKKGILLIYLFLALVIYPKGVFAEEEFATSYEVNYDVGTNGVTVVTQKITLKNLTSQYYASNFTLTTSSTSISDISATDDSGPMEVKSDTKDNKTSISVKFNQQIAGLDKAQTFTLKFKSKDFADQVGKTWEVNLPRMPDSSNISNFSMSLSVPVSFGDPTSMAPKPKSQSSSPDKISFFFTKDQLDKSGVSVNFGTDQIFDFNLKYHLDNNSLFPVLTSVTLPPDTEYQDVLISNISPEPLNVTIDEDGNYLAWYQLSRRSKQEVIVTGSAKLYINSKVKKSFLLSYDQQQAYTKTDQYWEKDNPAIRAALSEIFKSGTPRSNREKARMVYRYVVNTLKYDTTRLSSDGIERFGAVTALNNPNRSICMEFTDLFIALSRAAGVPTRELDGFAYSQNKTLRPVALSGDLLHAWPEYFDEEKNWVMVDPTWENTSGGADYFNKFDLNHLVLAVKGVSSKTPYTSDDVKVTLAQNDFLGKPQTEVNIGVPDVVWAGFPISASVKVSNVGNAVLPGGVMTLSTGQLKILGDKPENFGSIPPFGSTEFKFNLRTPDFWQSYEDIVEVDIAGRKYTKKVSIKPLIYFQPFQYAFAGFIALLIGIYGLVLVVHLVSKRSQKD